MEEKFTQENTEKAGQAKSAEELTADETEACLERTNDSSELSDDDLNSVSGGGDTSNSRYGYVLINDVDNNYCDYMVCGICGKKVHPAFYINHTCKSNNLVPNVCHHCKFMMTRFFDTQEQHVFVCRYARDRKE